MHELIYIRSHPKQHSIGFVNKTWERTRLRVTFGRNIKNETQGERRKQVLLDFVSEREGKQVLIWKCSFDNSSKDMI